jgi:hypothetical protein
MIHYLSCQTNKFKKRSKREEQGIFSLVPNTAYAETPRLQRKVNKIMKLGKRCQWSEQNEQSLSRWENWTSLKWREQSGSNIRVSENFRYAVGPQALK